MPPTALINSIDSVRRRARRLSVAYGTGIAVASAIGLLLAVIALDWLLNLYALPRVLLILISLGTFAWCVWRYIAKPATAKVSLSDVAGRLERAFPQFEDRLRSTINFAEGANPGSSVLQQRTIEQATRIAGQINLAEAVVAKPAIVSVTSAAAAVLVVLLMAGTLLDRATLGIIASRLVTPFSAKAWPKRVQIDVGDGLPGKVAVGQKINIAMSLARGDKPSLKPILYYQLDNGPVQQVFLSRGDGASFAASLDARLEQGQTAGTLKAWIEAGDDRQDLPPISVVPRLAIRTIVANITPPDYAVGRPTQTQEMSNAPAVAAEGSRVTISIGFNKPLGSTEPTLEPLGQDASLQPATRPATQPAAVAWSRAAGNTAIATFAADTSRRFRIRAVDADGFSNTAIEEYELIVRPDTNLSIQLENPRKSEERTANAFVPLQAVAEDDCGVSDVRLVVNRLQPSPKSWDVPMVKAGQPVEKNIRWQALDASQDRVRYRLNAQWELAGLELTPGDVIEYALVAQDNYDLNGKRHPPVSTSKLRITIVSPDELAARVTDELRGVKASASLLRTAQQRAKQDTEQLAKDTADKPQLDAGDQSVNQRLTQQQSSAAASAKQLGDRVQQSLDRLAENRSPAEDLKNTAAEVRDTLTKAGEGPMKDAAQDLANAGQKERAADARAGDMKAAQDQQQKALAQLDRALAKLDSVGSLQGSMNEINAILSEQKSLRQANEDFAKTNLGKKPEDLKAGEKQTLDSIAERQKKLADRTQKALDAMAKQAEQMKRSDPASADAMAAAAKQGEQSKVAPDQQRASQQTSQNQQANAQQTQKQVELGLEQVLGQLKEAQKRELARLREKLAELQEQIATLIRRQSGHNLDSLTLQNKLDAADKKLIEALKADANRKPDAKLATPPLLTSGQELTGRNTRDLASNVDAQPQTAEVGARLGRAAGQMERSIVSLRAAKLGDAYDPHQVDALLALKEAKDLVDQQKKEADQKNQDQQKESIRQRYVALLEKQKAVNADTSKVEKSRDAAGNVRRTEWPMLAKLPKSQTDIAADTAKMEEDLEALESVVYIWANRDIKQAMDASANDLTQKKTGVPTQAEQERIVEELTAMIKNLEEKPPEPKKFENAGGGGGGGQGQQQAPKMPTEAELKLLKSLQTAVNTSTTKIAAEPKADAARLATLGGRQGDLRNLLDNLLKKASGEKKGLEEEPENKDQLPEEAQADQQEDKDLENTLLGEDLGKKQEAVDKNFQLIGTRMARSRQRLSLNSDPGKVTQTIQKKILDDLDQLIELAQKNSQQQQASSSPKPGQQPPKPGDNQQANNQGQNQPSQGQQGSQSQQGATNQNSAGAGSKPHDLKDITETASEWGQVTPRVRQAVIDSRGESIVEQYRKMIEDYYGALSNQSGKKR